MADDRFLIVGLGNPGNQYLKTRHNAGFLAIDYFADKIGAQFNTEKLGGLYCTARLAGKQVFLLKPQTYMNKSGECVGPFARYFNIPTANVLVIHDDLDLPPDKVKIVSEGGAGGHNGILSTIRHLSTNEFSRIKIGIGRPPTHDNNASIPVEKFVLSRFSDEEWQMFQENLKKVEEGIGLFVNQDIAAAMNKINTRKR